MKHSILALSLIFIFTLMNFTDGYSQQRERKLYKFKQDRVIDNLNLSDAQKDKISELRTAHQKRMVDLNSDFQKALIDMKEERRDTDLNRSKMISAVEKINTIKNKIAVERVNHRMDIYEQLNDEQKKIWREHEPLRLRGEGRSGFLGERKLKRDGSGFGSGYGW